MNSQAAPSNARIRAGITPQDLFDEVLLAHQRMYRFAQPTPAQALRHPCGAMYRIKHARRVGDEILGGGEHRCARGRNGWNAGCS